ncbi:MAG: DHH family phosphoesterase [Nanoarchaeota archaeon]|nr:DHH family phosphoesterase [Nanoarchaeota archaeon]
MKKIKNKGLIEKFEKYILGIEKNDKIGIIYHSDPDGVASAVILSRLIKKVGSKDVGHLSYIPNPSMIKSAVNKMKSKGINKLIISDVSADQFMGLKEFEGFSEVLILDHHNLYKDINSKNITLIKPQMIFHDVNPDFYCAAKLCFDLGNMITDLRNLDWVSVIGIIGDSSYDHWKRFGDGVLNKYRIRKTKEGRTELDRITEVMFYSIAHNLKNTRICYDVLYNSRNYREAKNSGLQKYSKAIENEIKYWNTNVMKLAEVHPKLELIFDNIKPRYPINPSIIARLSSKNPNKTVVIAQDMNQEIINISARRADGKVHVNSLLENSIKNLKGANAGGHVRSAGGIIQKKDFFRFKENIFKLLANRYRNN